MKQLADYRNNEYRMSRRAPLLPSGGRKAIEGPSHYVKPLTGKVRDDGTVLCADEYEMLSVPLDRLETWDDSKREWRLVK